MSLASWMSVTCQVVLHVLVEDDILARERSTLVTTTELLSVQNNSVATQPRNDHRVTHLCTAVTPLAARVALTREVVPASFGRR